MKFEVDTELFPFPSHFLETRSGAEVHYVDEGEAASAHMIGWAQGNGWIYPISFMAAEKIAVEI